jgi:DnaK suppressor protein
MEEVTYAQAAELRTKLLTLRAELKAQMTASADGARPVELDQGAVGRVSRMDALQQQKMVEAQRVRAGIRLQQVDAALEAFGDDAYGLCRMCDDPIGFKRLQARPESPLCLPCQREVEARR